jgi:hypothetical protein
MADSEVAIVNQVLVQLGQTPLVSLDDETDVALTARTLYAPTRDEILADHPWNFAIRRAGLVQIADPPAPADPIPLYGFAYAYQLPPGGESTEPPYCLRVLDTSEDGTWGSPVSGWWGPWNWSELWQVEGRTLVTNATAIQIRYAGRITDTVLFAPWFERALVAALTAKLAGPLRQSDAAIELWEKKFERALSRARAIDGQEGRYAPRAAYDLLIVR